MVESSDGKMEKTVDWKEEIAWIAGPFSWRETRESWLRKAADTAGISYRMAKALFYGQSVDPKESIAKRVRGAAEQARQEARALASRFETIAGGLNASDPDFHSSDIAALIGAARALRGLDSARDHRDE